MSETEDETDAAGDPNATANYTIKDVPAHVRRRLARYRRKHGLASRQMLESLLEAGEARDSRLEVIGPTISHPPADNGLPAVIRGPTTADDRIARLERLTQIARAATPGKDSEALREARRQTLDALRDGRR